MSLKGKLSAQIEIKSDGDVFHELYRDKPHHIPNISPQHIQAVDFLEGEPGTVGSVTLWNYTDDGNPRVGKAIAEAIDEAKKSVTFKVIDGDLLTLYKYFIITVHVDTEGESNLVTWTFDFEKLNVDTPYPFTFTEFALNVTKDIEAHHLK